MTTITIQDSSIKGGDFKTLLDFVQTLDVGVLLDFRKENREDLSPEILSALQELEQEGTADCVNI